MYLGQEGNNQQFHSFKIPSGVFYYGSGGFDNHQERFLQVSLLVIILKILKGWKKGCFFWKRRFVLIPIVPMSFVDTIQNLLAHKGERELMGALYSWCAPSQCGR